MTPPTQHNLSAPPRVFTWDTYEADEAGVKFGPCGSTTDRGRAVRALGDALRDGPAGASGVVFKVELDPIGTARYEYGGMVARAQHDRATGCVVWADGAPRRASAAPDRHGQWWSSG